jgi:hypothetical protein
VKFQELLKNRTFQIAAGIVVVIGVYVAMRRKSDGSGGSTDSTQPTSGGTVYSTVPSNTTATDIASWMGDYSGSLQQQLNAYSTSLDEQIQTLQNLGTGESGNGNGDSQYLTLTAKTGWDWDQFVNQAEQVNSANTVAKLMELNPTMQPNVGSDNRFKSWADYKILGKAKATV